MDKFNFSKILYILFSKIFFVSCSLKEYDTKSSLILIKTPKFSYADQGFIKTFSKGDIEIEIFSNSTMIFNLIIQDDLICKDYKCSSLKEFNEKFLNKYYEKDFLRNIFLKKPIFKSENLLKFKDGFKQRIKNKKYDIFYEFKNHTLKFRDFKNKILIKLKTN